MKALTVNDLFLACREEIAKGNGNRRILLSGDDEGNTYHELFFLFTHMKGNDIGYGLPYGVSEDDFNNHYIVLG